MSIPIVTAAAAHPAIAAVGVAIVAPILLVVGSPAIVSALTKEEASRCRAMRNYIERRDCFNL